MKDLQMFTKKLLQSSIIFMNRNNTRLQNCKKRNMLWKNAKITIQGWYINLFNIGIFIEDLLE